MTLNGVMAHYVKVVEDRYTDILSASEMQPENLAICDIPFMAIFSWGHVTPNEGLEVKRPSVVSENLIYNQL